MKEKKYCIALDDFEKRVVVNCMNLLRSIYNSDILCLCHQTANYIYDYI